jgi:hypothetical protein
VQLPDNEDTIIVGRPDADDADTIIGRPAPLTVAVQSEIPAWGSMARDVIPVYSVDLGDRIESLSAPLVIGRNPSPPRIAKGMAPRMVRVSSPLKEISSSHLEIRQEGTTVVVTDLGSTNGTIVTIPGAASQRLRSAESIVVVPGSIIDLGDSVVIEVLPLGVGIA